MVKQLEENKITQKREAFFKRVGEEAKLPLPMIVQEEVEWAEEIVDTKKGFWCPLGHYPLFCDGYSCETDVYDKCMEFLKANQLLRKVRIGEIMVQWQTMKVRL